MKLTKRLIFNEKFPNNCNFMKKNHSVLLKSDTSTFTVHSFFSTIVMHYTTGEKANILFLLEDFPSSNLSTDVAKFFSQQGLP